MKKVRSSVYVECEVDPIDVLDELNDQEHEAIAKSWGFVPVAEDGKSVVIDAINQIRVGKYEDAIVTLERAFLPTWRDEAACDARYREVMAENARTPVAQAQEAT